MSYETYRSHKSHWSHETHWSYKLALRQPEEEAAAPTLAALGLKGTDGEYLTRLAVLLDNALTVQQSETVAALHLVFEDVGQLLVGHADAGVVDAHLHIAVALGGADGHLSALGCELPGVVGQGVDHEEGQYAVGLHDGGGGLHVEGQRLQHEAAAAAGYDVEDRLQREALHAQAQLSLSQLYPLCQQGVVLLYLLRQLADIVQAFLVIGTVLSAPGLRKCPGASPHAAYGR